MEYVFFGLAGLGFLAFILLRKRPEPEGGVFADAENEKPKPEARRDAGEIKELIRASAESIGVSPALALALAEDESSFNPDAFNRAENAIGLFQIRPIAFQEFVNRTGGRGWTHSGLFDPVKNAAVGTWYMRWLSEVIRKAKGRQATSLEILQAFKGGITNFLQGKTSKSAAELAARAYGRISVYA